MQANSWHHYFTFNYSFKSRTCGKEGKIIPPFIYEEIVSRNSQKKVWNISNVKEGSTKSCQQKTKQNKTSAFFW